MELEKLFNPKSVAVIGASRDKRKIGNIIFKNLISKFEGKVYAINPNANEIYGHKCYKNVYEVKEKIDLGIICLNYKNVFSVLKESSRKIKNFIIISSGFKEVGNFKEEEKIRSFSNKKKIKVLGPNCLGIINFEKFLNATFIDNEKIEFKKGSLSIITQSGAIGASILEDMIFNKIGISKFISYGNAMQIDENDIIEYLYKDENTKEIFLYLEGVKNGKKFLNVCKKVSSKKPIIVYKAGKMEKGKKAALSHTGNLAGNYEIYKAVFKQLNLIEVESLREAVFVSKILSSNFEIKGNRVGIITNGGGFGIVASDAAEANGLKVVDFESSTKKILKKKIPIFSNISNPLDLTAEANEDVYKDCIEALIHDKNIDLILVIIELSFSKIDKEKMIEKMKEINFLTTKPVFFFLKGYNIEVFIKQLEEIGIKNFDDIETLISAISKVFKYYKSRAN